MFGALGVGIGFGLQSVVNNFVSGLILMFERPIKVGDRIETTGRLGTVTRIGMRASTVRTFDGAEVIVPNGDLISKEVINWTLSDKRRRVEVSVRVAEGSDVKAVLDVLQRVAATHPDVLDDPAPAAFMMGANAGALEFRLFAWPQGENTLKTTSDLYVGVSEALEQAGIRSAMPRPARAVGGARVRTGDRWDGGPRPVNALTASWITLGLYWFEELKARVPTP